jgi:signal transduction histidine kinase
MGKNLEGRKPELKFRIRTKMLLAFLGLSLISLTLFGYVALSNIRGLGDYALEKSASLGESAANDATKSLEELGMEMIKQKALDVARQMEIYISDHPEMTIEELKADPALAEIAVQPVGETGYTSVLDFEGINIFHYNPEIIGYDMDELKDKLPDFYALVQKMKTPNPGGGYYKWQDPDGIIRDKYLYHVRVRGTDWKVGATTYIDEFSKPVEETKKKIAATALSVNEHINTKINNTRHTFIGVLMAMILVVSGVSFLLSRAITNPIMALTKAAQSIERGERFEPESITSLTRARDELARLAKVFSEMAIEVQAREEQLKRQVEELRIKIDEVRKVRQVAEITETEYFQHLREYAAKMREGAKGDKSGI